MPTKEHKDKAPKESERKAQEDELDEALDESFPASDPPASTAPGHGAPDEKEHGKGHAPQNDRSGRPRKSRR
jgi:hypothetical protein